MKLGLSTCTYTWNFGVANYPQPSHPFTLDVLFDKAFNHHIPVVQILDNIVPLHLFSDSAEQIRLECGADFSGGGKKKHPQK